jgi:hypothetical protein
MIARERQEWRDTAEYFAQVRENQIAKIITDTCHGALIPYMRNYPNKVVTVNGQTILARIPEHQKGKPDFTILCLRGITVWVETKRPKAGKFRPEQLRWREWIISRGHEYYAPQTIEEAHCVSKRILEVGR